MNFTQRAENYYSQDDRYKLTRGVQGWSVWWRSTDLSPHNRVARDLPTCASAMGWCREHEAERAKEAYLA